MKTLREAKIGETVKVVKLHGEGAVKRRIMDMGITKGVQVYVRKVAPLGDPMELNLRGYELSVRKGDAELVADAAAAAAPEVGKGIILYYLQPGETVWNLAKRCRVP